VSSFYPQLPTWSDSARTAELTALLSLPADSYWAIGLHPGASHFFKFLIYLFLGVFAAESQSLLLASIVPIFVAALALAAFANGLWMVVQGYFIRASSLPRWLYYSLHFIVSRVSPPF
jgi:ABC-type multidrug transport system permease subunit